VAASALGIIRAKANRAARANNTPCFDLDKEVTAVKDFTLLFIERTDWKDGDHPSIFLSYKDKSSLSIFVAVIPNKNGIKA